MQLIEQRDNASANDDFPLELQLSRQIKAGVKCDKAKWLDEKIAEDDWLAIRNIKGKKKQRVVSLKNSRGQLVGSELKAETMAEYFERIQWAVKPTSDISSHTIIHHNLDVNCNSISFEEMCEAEYQLENNKKPGADDIPNEFWNAVCLPGSRACRWIVQFVHSIRLGI